MIRDIYLDNSATTRPYDEVIHYINYINKNIYGNPSSLHTKGSEAERLIKKARETIANTIGVDTKEIVFTSGGTESNNLAIRGYLEANPRKGRHIITSQIEHPSILELFKYLEPNGYKVDYIGVGKDGIINLDELKNKINKETSLISIMHINNEIGSIQPIEEVAKIKNSLNREACLHVDCVQSYGKMKISPKKMSIDMISISSHKIHGPKGAGALFVNKGVKIKPIIIGGGQEALLRSGTENITGIAGFGLAAETIHKSMETNNSKVLALKNLFIEKLKENIETTKFISSESASPYILNVSLGRLRSEVLLHHLEEKNIFVSTGSACSSRKNLHSHVLKAVGIETCDIEGAVRFSFSEFNTEEDINDTIEALKNIVPKIQISRGGKR
ncbi:MAG: cysteine desulfurase [Clostridia bacterium]|nr:cysteine desulfurase [Clostridia bacterium]